MKAPAYRSHTGRPGLVALATTAVYHAQMVLEAMTPPRVDGKTSLNINVTYLVKRQLRELAAEKNMTVWVFAASVLEQYVHERQRDKVTDDPSV
jgi:hypothetical protein